MANEQNQNPPAQPPLQDRARGRGEILPFTVEFADNNCRNFTISTPPFNGVDIRGRYDTAMMAQRPQRMRDLGTAGNRIPSPMFGARLTIDVRKRTARLFDPLGETEEGKKLLKEYNNVAATTPALKKNCGPFETIEHELHEDQLKTLLYELRRKWDSKCLLMVEGELPTVKQIDQLDGHELYDPSNDSQDKPYYKKDLQAFRDKQRMAGV